jgi:esterase/lipase
MRRIASKLTMQVMESIYKNTVINYDHLTAYLLKYYPRKRLSLFNLASRLYLSAETLTKLTGMRFHADLLNEQWVQFCRTYHKILVDFLEVAAKSGAVELEGDLIHRKKLIRNPLVDFHSIRRENTYQVILNEVEYLRPLTTRLRRIAKLTPWLLRWRLRRRFIKISNEEFVRDYRNFQREGESKPRKIGAPVFYRRFRPKAGVLLVHGYLAAPEEVRPLAKYLYQHGYTVFAPRLRGHGTSPEDLANRTWEDWLQSVERGYLILANSCDDIFLGGFSMGAGLSLFAATNALYKVRAVFGINCAMRLRRRTARLAPAAVLWNKLVDILIKDEGRRHFVANEPENPHINYLRNPISGVKELMELMEKLSERLDRIKVPALLIQASDDPVVHPEGSKQVYEGLGSQDKQLIMVDSDRHGILRGKISERVFMRLLEFLDGRV